MTTNGKASKEINTPKEKKETAAMELLDEDSHLLGPTEKSPTSCNFEIFDHNPQLDIKFWNLTSNFEIHKNIS